MRFLIAFICLMGGTLFAQTTQPANAPAATETKVNAMHGNDKAKALLEKQVMEEAKQKNAEKEKLDKLGISMSDKNVLGGLSVGDMAPKFSGIDQNGKTIDLEELLKEGEVVVIFYRGYWCEICNKHLSTLQTQLSSITDKGATVVAITTESNEYAKKTSDKNELSFSVISDSSLSILSDYKVLYEVSEFYQHAIHRHVKTPISEFNDSEDSFLPIPATYVIDKKGKISWVDYNINYRERASVEEITNALK